MKTNEEFFKEYKRKLKAESLGERTRATAEQSITHFLNWCGDRNLAAFTQDDVFDFIDFVDERTFIRKGVTCKLSPATVNKEKTIIKKFLTSVSPELGNIIKLKAPKNELPDILTQEDVEKLIEVSLTPRDKALIAVLYESGARRGELLSLRLKNVTFDEYGAVITLPKSKTKTRRIRLIYAVSYLRQFIDCHPLKDNREAFLFCSLHTPYGVISSSGLHYQLRCIAERAGIPIEKVYPHNFRHSRATHLSEHLTEAQLKELFGWTPGSNMTSVYVHLAGSDIDKAILEMHGLKKDEEKKLTVIKCQRCKELNPESADYCFKCNLPLKEPLKFENELEELRAKVNAIEKDREQMLKNFKSLMNNSD